MPEPLRISKIKHLEKNKRRRDFFTKDASTIAKRILGDYLVMKNKDSFLVGRIVETESYLGIIDDASHAWGRKITERNRVMYAPGGVIYVYFIYGKYWCFNIIVSEKENPQAVLIRALEPLEGIEIMKKNRGVSELKKLTNGPCRWTQAFGIDKRFLGKSIESRDLFISLGPYKSFEIVHTKRIGIDYATHSKDSPLRFYIRGNEFISKG